jgi:hypothetical protein
VREDEKIETDGVIAAINLVAEYPRPRSGLLEPWAAADVAPCVNMDVALFLETLRVLCALRADR